MSGVGSADKPRGACPCLQLDLAFAEIVTILIKVKHHKKTLVRAGADLRSGGFCLVGTVFILLRHSHQKKKSYFQFELLTELDWK